MPFCSVEWQRELIDLGCEIRCFRIDERRYATECNIMRCSEIQEVGELTLIGLSRVELLSAALNET
jgi:hypothetical protein